MTENDERSWNRANVVIAATGVISSVVISLSIAIFSHQSAQAERRSEALSEHQAALTRYKYAIQMLRAAASQSALTTYQQQQRWDSADATGTSPSQQLPPILSSRVTVAAHAAADAGVNFIATYDIAAEYFDDVPHTKACSERLQTMAGEVIPLGGLEDVTGLDVSRSLLQQTEGFAVQNPSSSAHYTALDSLGDAVAVLISDERDSPHACDAVRDLSAFGRHDLAPLPQMPASGD